MRENLNQLDAFKDFGPIGPNKIEAPKKEEIAQKYNIIASEDNLKKITEKEGEWFFDNEPIEEYKKRIDALYNDDSDYVRGQK